MIPRILMHNKAESLGRTTPISGSDPFTIMSFLIQMFRLFCFESPEDSWLPRENQQGPYCLVHGNLMQSWILDIRGYVSRTVPRTFRAIKASCQTGIHLFGKADLLT